MMSDEYFGHKTFRDGNSFRHEPISKDEAAALHAQVLAADVARALRFPTEQSAIDAMMDAWIRLKELGWKEADYAPADDKVKFVVEVGSSGIHHGRCRQRDTAPSLPIKWWWIEDGHDVYPSKPFLYREVEVAPNPLLQRDILKPLHAPDTFGDDGVMP